MQKTITFILCAIMFVIGALGTISEIYRMVENGYTMSDDQWVGEVLMLIIYGTMATGCAIYAVRMWNNKTN